MRPNPAPTAPVASKVTGAHLRRHAYLYVRQSTIKQVLHNTESALRQYDLRGRAIALGWQAEQIIVIDIDQGQSGASAADREGFQRLVAEVGMGRAGIVLGLECSRLARNNADWHRLLEICALSGTLICDEDGLYDPTDFNDRMLLGMKGQLSEAELHFLRSRLRGGILSKARRGELITPLPVGLAYDGRGRVVLDPDRAVQHAITHLFATFDATGSAHAVVKTCHNTGLLFPRRHRKGPHKGELDWAALTHSAVLRVLHSPRYAGVFSFGRTRQTLGPNHKTRTRPVTARHEQIAFIPDAHPGYIARAAFDANQARLTECAAAHGADRKAGPPREGPALLQGIIICGHCGRRMTVRYHLNHHGTELPTYVCQHDKIKNGGPDCQTIPGAGIDTAIGALLIDAQNTYDQATNTTTGTLTDMHKARIRQLVTDLPAIFNDPHTPHRERKRMARLLLTDVTVTKTADTITCHIRLPGGQHHTLTLPTLKPAWLLRKTSPQVVAAIDDLLDHHTHTEIADILNTRGLTSGEGRPLHKLIVAPIARNYQLQSREQRLRTAGMLTL